MTGTLNPYLRTVACKSCPFRRSMVGTVRAERAAEIAQGLLTGGSFTCHKTTVPDEDDTEMVPGPRAQECAGALATMESAGQAGQVTRIAERLGLYDPTRLQIDRSDVFPSLAEWVEAHREFTELVHCEVVSFECEDPAGYSFGGNVSHSLDEPMCDPDVGCESCGRTMCESCRAPRSPELCVHCAEELDEEE